MRKELKDSFRIFVILYVTYDKGRMKVSARRLPLCMEDKIKKEISKKGQLLLLEKYADSKSSPGYAKRKHAQEMRQYGKEIFEAMNFPIFLPKKTSPQLTTQKEASCVSYATA